MMKIESLKIELEARSHSLR